MVPRKVDVFRDLESESFQHVIWSYQARDDVVSFHLSRLVVYQHLGR